MIDNYTKQIVLDFCNMNLHVGKRIKQVMDYNGITAIVLAKKINKSRENIYDIYNRENIDTGLLDTIGNALNHNFFADLYNVSTGDPFSNGELPLDLVSFNRKDENKTVSDESKWKDKYYELLEKYASVLEANKRTAIDMPELKAVADVKV